MMTMFGVHGNLFNSERCREGEGMEGEERSMRVRREKEEEGEEQRAQKHQHKGAVAIRDAYVLGKRCANLTL